MGASNKIAKRVKYFLGFIPDKAYIQIYYFARFKKFANIKSPETFNEKLQWLKLYDHNPLYTKLVDKYEVKKYVADIIGDKYIIPTLGVWDNFDDIDFDSLPNQFVLKCTHDSEGIVIVKDKNSFDFMKAKSIICDALKHNFYYIGREWPYKNVKPRIIAEKYMEDHFTGELRDYKFFCFDGMPKLMLLASGRGNGDLRFDYYDMDFNHMDIWQDHPNSELGNCKPKNFETMINISRKLSVGFKHVRVDLYEVDGEVFFGELTFYHHSGFAKYSPSEWDTILGNWLELPNKQ